MASRASFTVEAEIKLSQMNCIWTDIESVIDINCIQGEVLLSVLIIIRIIVLLWNLHFNSNSFQIRNQSRVPRCPLRSNSERCEWEPGQSVQSMEL